jgi:hypothetical protein
MPSHAMVLLPLQASPAAQTKLPKLLLLILPSKNVQTMTVPLPLFAKKPMLRVTFSL